MFQGKRTKCLTQQKTSFYKEQPFIREDSIEKGQQVLHRTRPQLLLGEYLRGYFFVFLMVKYLIVSKERIPAGLLKKTSPDFLKQTTSSSRKKDPLCSLKNGHILSYGSRPTFLPYDHFLFNGRTPTELLQKKTPQFSIEEGQLVFESPRLPLGP